ncbi:tetratricopeptide repeat protein [Candidatus Pseudothioglobus singularis]|nr:tetratricopeptide repeat protein [Candidatus Pseudothioglobus singularis]
MIKKAKSLLFSNRKNKKDLKKEAKSSDDSEKLLENDNQPNDQLSLEKHEIDKPIEPPKVELESLINLYSEGKYSEVLALINDLLSQFPYSVDLHNIAGASNAGLRKFDDSINNYKQAIKINPDFADAHNNIGNAFLGKGELDNAITSYKKASLVKPDYTEAYLNMGNALMDKGMIGEAIDSYKEAIKTNPDLAIAYYLIANAFLQRDELDEAIANYKKATLIFPDYTEAYLNMGNALMDKGMLNEAINNFKEVIKINPDYADAFNNMGNAFQVKGDLESAIDFYYQAVKLKPDFAEAFNNLGSALRGRLELNDSIDNFKQAIKLKPYYVDAYCNMGDALFVSGRYEEAIESCKQAIRIDPNYSEAYYNMGNALMEKGDLVKSIESFKKAIKLRPHYAEAYNNLGVALQDYGYPKVAIDSYKQAIKIKSDYTLAFRNLTNLHTYKEYNNYFLEMQSLCQDPGISDEQRCDLNFALSKASEDLNEVSKSFNYLKTGNELRKKILAYDIEQDIELFGQLKKAHPSIALHSSVEKSEVKPIFILGMPRSGTTLVEQILSSHSEVTGAGELHYIDSFGESIAKGEIKSSVDIILNFKKNYIEALKIKSNGNPIVIDKMPQNFLYIGLIFSAFPDAKVIHVNRDPAATCWSNYKHYFTSEGLGYAYDIDDTVRYFGLYQDLMQFWRSYYGDRIYELNYDNLTVNQEQETRSLIQYLELKWESECLSPQKNKRSVQTASQQQVRQKVYQGSSKQWHKFEPFLNGKLDKLT